MNVKRLLAAALAVFVSVQLIELFINSFLMKSANEELNTLWRPDMSSKMWIMVVFGALTSLLFAYIFVKGREGKGLMEGLRFGVLMWLFISVPMNVAWWVMLPIRHIFLVRWILFGLVEMLVAGILVAVIYKPADTVKTRP
jgi:hypothetical protein